jgi:hypothetical protein
MKIKIEFFRLIYKNHLGKYEIAKPDEFNDSSKTNRDYFIVKGPIEKDVINRLENVVKELNNHNRIDPILYVSDSIPSIKIYSSKKAFLEDVIGPASDFILGN